MLSCYPRPAYIAPILALCPELAGSSKCSKFCFWGKKLSPCSGGCVRRRLVLSHYKTGGGERNTLSQSSSSHATSATGYADWPHVVAWAGLSAGTCATPPCPAVLSGTSIPTLSRSPSPGPTSAMTIFSFIALYYCVCCFEVTVTSVSLSPFMSHRGHSNTNQRLSLLLNFN